MNKNQVDFVARLAKIDANKTKDSLFDELKEMYKHSIKLGNRREFIGKVKCDVRLMNQQSITEICVGLGEKMFSFANVLGEYTEFIKWLEKMTGQPLLARFNDDH